MKEIKLRWYHKLFIIFNPLYGLYLQLKILKNVSDEINELINIEQLR